MLKVFGLALLLSASFVSYAKCNLSIGVVPIPGIIDVSGNHASGLFIDKFQQQLSDKQVDVEFITFNFARLLELAKKGQIDGIMPLIKEKDRLDYLDYSNEALGAVKLSLWQKQGKVINFNNSQPTIATIRSLAGKAKALNQESFIEMPDMKQALAMVKRNRVDYALVVDEVAQSFGQTVFEKAQTVAKLPVYLGLSKKAPNYEKSLACLH